MKKFRIIGNIIVIVILLILAVIFGGSSSAPSGEAGTETTYEYVE